MKRQAIQDLVRWLQLASHPEGGYYRETYRSAETVAAGALPARFAGNRSFGTSIYFLLPADTFSAFHRIRQDEVWHFHGGGTLIIHAIDGEGRYSIHRLGMDPERDGRPQAVIPAGSWFGAEVEDGDYVLAGCTVAPGFDFADFEMGGREALLKEYPRHAEIILRLTRG